MNQKPSCMNVSPVSLAVMLVVALLVSACSSKPVSSADLTAATTAVRPTVTPTATTGALLPIQPHTFERMFVIVLENEGLAQVQRDAYFADLAHRGALLTNYSAVAHPSQPNYIAQIAGDTFVRDDGNHDLPQTNLVDVLEAAGVSWKTYQENYPGGCYAKATADGGLYARKHNPFISFNSIRNDPQRCAKIVNADQLPVDIAARQLPQVAFYTPNQRNDGHDTGLAFASAWLKRFLEPKLADPTFIDGTLVVVTFDESNTLLGNRVFTVLLGPSIMPGIDAHIYTHYDLLRSIEINFGLAGLQRNDARANGFASTNFRNVNR